MYNMYIYIYIYVNTNVVILFIYIRKMSLQNKSKINNSFMSNHVDVLILLLVRKFHICTPLLLSKCDTKCSGALAPEASSVSRGSDSSKCLWPDVDINIDE
jgi:hypothetical protein